MSVYFVRRVDGVGPVKVGHSRDVERRLANVQEWLPFEVAVLATLPGGAAEEHDIHHAFSAARLRGEWFKATAGLLALVEHAKARGSGERLSFAEIDAFAAIDGNVPKRGAAYERVAAAAARVVIPCDDRDAARLVLAALRALASRNPSVAEALRSARIEGGEP